MCSGSGCPGTRLTRRFSSTPIAAKPVPVGRGRCSGSKNGYSGDAGKRHRRVSCGDCRAAPFLQDRVGELRDWTDLRLLTVRVNRLRQWHRPGLVCIGDAAHAMSPVGGVGINLAIQDAVAAANMLAGPLREGAVSPRDLAKIQRRRAFPTRLTQRVQALIQKRLPCRLRNRVIAVGIRQACETPDVSLAQAGPATHNPKCERSDAG